jgi:hypothetical protein
MEATATVEAASPMEAAPAMPTTAMAAAAKRHCGRTAQDEGQCCDAKKKPCIVHDERPLQYF